MLDRDARCWITRNLEGPNVGAEIWTHVFVVSERVLDIVVDFFVPDVPKTARDKVGMAYANAYENSVRRRCRYDDRASAAIRSDV